MPTKLAAVSFLATGHFTATGGTEGTYAGTVCFGKT